MVQDRLLAYARHKVHPQVRTWLSAEVIETNLRSELKGDLERLHSDALAAEFAHHCSVAGADPDEYKTRLLTVGELELLVGVRFVGLDINQPFVDVMYQSGATLTPEQLSAVQDAIRKAFAIFKPKRTRFYLSSHLPPLGADGDKRLIAAPLGVMLEQPELYISRVNLKEATSLVFYPRYAAIYEELYTEQPQLRAVARVEREDDLQEYLDESHLFEIFVDERWAGLAAVFKDVSTGLSGFCVGEIALAKTFRGRGFGGAAQLQLAAQLVKQGAGQGELLFGTIGAVNVAAQRAALRAGRIDLGGHVWVPAKVLQNHARADATILSS